QRRMCHPEDDTVCIFDASHADRAHALFEDELSPPLGTSPSLASTQAVPIVGWPANGISECGVKMRTRAAWAGFSGGSTNVVSEKFISRAIRCMSRTDRSLPSRTTANWLPASGFSVKTSTMRSVGSFRGNDDAGRGCVREELARG